MHLSSKHKQLPDDKSFNATTVCDGEEDTTVSPQSPLQWLTSVTTEEEEDEEEEEASLSRFSHWFESPGGILLPDYGATAYDFIMWTATRVPSRTDVKLLPRQC